jgi:hypothetical protein
MADLPLPSLYVLLAEEASDSAEPGETSITRTKETVDNDQELVWLEVANEI